MDLKQEDSLVKAQRELVDRRQQNCDYDSYSMSQDNIVKIHIGG